MTELRRSYLMTRKPTMQQYEELGKEMAFLCDRLTKLSCKLGQETGISKEPYKLAREASRALDKAKSEAEELMFLHYPEASTGVFYRIPSDPQAGLP